MRTEIRAVRINARKRTSVFTREGEKAIKNGQLERKDEQTLKAIYNKLTIHGTLKEPLTTEEQVLIFCIAEWIRKIRIAVCRF